MRKQIENSLPRQVDGDCKSEKNWRGSGFNTQSLVTSIRTIENDKQSWDSRLESINEHSMQLCQSLHQREFGDGRGRHFPPKETIMRLQ
jgi:hypothetical protein